MTGEFLARRTSNAENVPIWWSHHGEIYLPSELLWHVLNLLCIFILIITVVALEFDRISCACKWWILYFSFLYLVVQIFTFVGTGNMVFHLDNIKNTWNWHLADLKLSFICTNICFQSVIWILMQLSHCDSNVGNLAMCYHILSCHVYFLTLGLFGRRVIVVTCVCPSVRLSVCPSVCLSVCLSVPIILVNTITQSVYAISPPNLLGGFNMALPWMVL